MNYEDYYSEVRHLAGMLKSEGMDDWAIKIFSPLEEEFTGTGIFMALRWNLGNFLLAQLGSEEAIVCAKQLYQKIDVALS